MPTRANIAHIALHESLEAPIRHLVLLSLELIWEIFVAIQEMLLM